MSEIRAVVGVPVYEDAELLEPALRSLLAQDFADFAVVVVDDSRSDEPARVVRRVSRDGPRIAYVRNLGRLGLVGSWRRALELAERDYAGAPYFAWAGGHDLYEPGWLRLLVEALDARPDAVLAYPLNDHVDEEGCAVRPSWRFETAGGRGAARTFASVVRRMVAGDMVYGLYRREALVRCGGLRPVLLPDRLLLAELSLTGAFVQVPRLLWHRRVFPGRGFSLDRQRAAIFPDGAPWHAAVPWPLVHAGVLGWTLGGLGRGRPRVGRAAGLALAVAYPLLTGSFAAARRLLRR